VSPVTAATKKKGRGWWALARLPLDVKSRGFPSWEGEARPPRVNKKGARADPVRCGLGVCRVCDAIPARPAMGASPCRIRSLAVFGGTTRLVSESTTHVHSEEARCPHRHWHCGPRAAPGPWSNWDNTRTLDFTPP
jgi:hypothetical protein